MSANSGYANSALNISECDNPVTKPKGRVLSPPDKFIFRITSIEITELINITDKK